MNSLGIKSAFLSGNEISQDYFTKPLNEVEVTKLWKLQKTIKYKLKYVIKY